MSTNITRLVVKNYRSLLDVDIALAPLTVFVGKNGVGKSNVIDVLRFVRDALADGFGRALSKRGNMKALRCWFADESEEISIELAFEGAEWSGKYGFSFGSGVADGYEIKSERLFFTRHTGNSPNLRQPNGQQVAEPVVSLSFEVIDGQLLQIPERIDGILMRNPNDPHPMAVSKTSLYLAQLGLVVPTIQLVRDFLINMSFYDLMPNHLRNSQQSIPYLPLWENGENLGSTLREIQDRKKANLITEALEVIVPEIEGYSIVPIDQYLITKLHYAFQNGEGFAKQVQRALNNEANGTIRMLGTLAALYQERYPSPLSIEEPEKEIYPDALSVCGDVLQEAALSYQVLVTTHSPDLIIYLPVNALRIVEREDGITKVGFLSSYQQEAIAEKLFSPGALMRIQGLERESEG